MQRNEIELMLLIAKAAPRTVLVDILMKACEEYRDNPSEETYHKVLFNCNMLLSKDVVESHGGIDGMMGTMDKFKQIKEKEDDENFKDILKDLNLNVEGEDKDN